MGTFRVELKKTVDDSYDIEVGRALAGRLVKDLEGGLMGGLKKFALITDSNVEDLYAQPVCRELREAGFPHSNSRSNVLRRFEAVFSSRASR